MKVRAFIAVPLSEEIRKKIFESSKRIRRLVEGMKLVEEENLHITLHFFGSVELSRVLGVMDEVCDELMSHSDFSLRIKGLGAFGSFERPRVLWFGVSEGYRELTELWRVVTSRVGQAGFELDDRPFHPHVTIGRFKGRPRAIRTKDLPMNADFGVDRVTSVRLYKSTLTPRGPIYEVLKECRLAGSA